MPPNIPLTSPEVPAHLALNPFQDLSGIDTSSFSNPYDALLAATNNNAAKLQERYSTHRTTRNTQQKAKLLAPDFEGVIIDPILQRLEAREEGYVDPRHCLVFWARPADHIKELIREVQERLRKVAPSLWIMPRENLHITVLEITHSKTAEEIEVLKGKIKPVAEKVVNYVKEWKDTAGCKLIRPMVGFDASALALSFVPAAAEQKGENGFTYHHLRRDVFDIVTREAGIKVDSRYVVPSAHLTIGRFITRKDFAREDGSVDQGKMEMFVKAIEEVNEWLEGYWDERAEKMGSWNVGEGEGIVLRWGTVWYGGGKTMAQTSRD